MTERKCILTGDRADPETLVRLAVGPEGQILPDIRAKAPGRGAWIGVTRPDLETALAKGKLKGALARAFKTNDLVIPDDLPAMIEDGLRRTLLDRLGLEARASMVLTGSEKIDVACRKGQVRLLLHASDAAADGNRKLDQALRVGQEAEGTDLAGITLPVDRHALSMAMGRDNVVHIAVIDSRAASRLRAAIGRLESYLGCATGTPAQAEHDSADAAGVHG
ncbi:MAG: DUF448 domain-containing protein [Sphingobium sp.]|uniref:DUF448 domain-containing protein n=1 Tax=Sphingobium sp. TaxID=1912891 RepID=UPI000DB07E7C|nr:DUF448 domain-containing protein [Sphingobium sp.]PZU10562.1 MAG: DUF448 domain-containing protein [Sphingobium sp.]